MYWYFDISHEYFLWQDLSMGTKIFTLWSRPWCLADLFKTLAMAITFEWCVLRLWYFKWVLLATRPSYGYHQIWPWPWCVTYLLKTLTIPLSFEWHVLSFECSLWQDLSMGTNRFDFVTLTLVFDLFIQNLSHGYNFWMVCTKTLIFHMSVCCDKTFPWVPTGLTLWPWP
jgi:hypothetical protein